MDIIQQIDDDLLKMLLEKFDTEEQQRFVNHFRLYLQHGNHKDKYIIDFDDVWEWIGFATKGSAKRHLLKYYTLNCDFKITNALNTDVKRFCQTMNGGQNKEQILMNVDTFKAFCMTANTEKGKQTRQYYTKMESIFFQYMEAKNKDIIERLQIETKKKLENERHNNLKEAHRDTPCVYLFKISERNDEEFIVKLGETDDIEQRISSLRQEHKDCILLDVFECTRPHKFEQYLLNRPDIKSHRIPGTELIQVSSTFTYKTLTTIINKHVDYFDNMSGTEKLEFAKLKCLETTSKERLHLIQLINITDDPNTKKQLTEILAKLHSDNNNMMSQVAQEASVENPEKKTDRLVYKYNIDNLTTPLCVFNSLKEAARSTGDPKIHDYHVRNACDENVILCNHRWFLVDDDAILPSTIPATKQEQPVQQKRIGIVAQINEQSNAILNVFPSQKDAATACKLAACTLTSAITKGTISAGYRWKMYDECSDDLKATFNGELPSPQSQSTSSKMVERIDPETDNVLETFQCIQDVCSQYKTCHKTIHKLNKSGDIYKGYKWRIIENIL